MTPIRTENLEVLIMADPTYPDYGRPQFERDVAEHRLTILRDEGLYRHLRCRRPDSGVYWFDIITWPGSLAINGDMGTFVFARVEDMFTFFRPDTGWNNATINPDYWGEKVQDGHKRLTRYSVERFRELVSSRVIDDTPDFPSLAAAVDQAIGDQLCLDYDIETENGAREFLRDFAHEEDGREFEFGDASWDWNLREWSWHYLWSCHAIAWAIARYDQAKALLTPAHATGGQS